MISIEGAVYVTGVGVGVDGAQRPSPTGRATRGMYVHIYVGMFLALYIEV